MADKLRRPQPHGGALRNGGTNAGGTGRPLSAVKIAQRLNPPEALQRLSLIVQGAPQLMIDTRKRGKVRLRSVSIGERIKALDVLVRIGYIDNGGERE